MADFNSLQSGDLLVWSWSAKRSKTKIDYLDIVRLLTISDFGHVSVVWNENGTMQHVEAVQPKIHKSYVPLTNGLYVIPMGLQLANADMESFFGDKIGLPYSLMDAFRGWVGFTLKDENKWQCAELTLEFYRAMGLNISGGYTPSRLIRRIMNELDKPLLKLNP